MMPHISLLLRKNLEISPAGLPLANIQHNPTPKQDTGHMSTLAWDTMDAALRC